MRDVVRRFVERVLRSLSWQVPQEISIWPMPRPSAAASTCWRADAGFPSEVYGLPGASEWPRGHCPGSCLNRGHKRILPSLAALWSRMVWLRVPNYLIYRFLL